MLIQREMEIVLSGIPPRSFFFVSPRYEMLTLETTNRYLTRNALFPFNLFAKFSFLLLVRFFRN